MEESFAVAFVPGVTPGKWERIWRERHPRRRLELVPMSQVAAQAALDEGRVQMALLRNVTADETHHAIPLYREQPVVVAERDSLIAAFTEIAVADLLDETVLEVDLEHGDGSGAVELVAANVGVAMMPQSVARALSRKDVVARRLVDAADTGISLVWLAKDPDPLTEVFIGIVRGRTQNSSR